MDLHAIEGKAKEILEKAKTDKEFHAQLKENPVKAIEGLTGIDLPDEQVKALAETVKAKLSLEDGLKGVEEKLGSLFHKKDE